MKMIDKLTGIQTLKDENEHLREQIQALKKQLKSPKAVIEAVIGRKTKWIDYEKMDETNQKKWFRATEELKRNAVFKSLFGYEDEDKRINGLLVRNLIEASVLESQNFRQMRDAQMSINGIELIHQYLDDIVDPDINVRDSNTEA